MVAIGDTVTVHYTGKLKDGTVFDSSHERGPIKFEVGDGRMIRGFDEAVLGMDIGERKTVELSPDEGYGQRDERNVITVPRERLGELSETVQEGDQLAVNTAFGPIPVTVRELTGESVTLDANHQLAGETLVFDIELVSIEEGTDGE